MTILLIPTYVEAFGRLKVDVASVYFLRKYPLASSEYIGVVNVISLISSSTIVALLIGFSAFVLNFILPLELIDIQVYYAVIVAVPFLIFNSGVAYAALGNDDIKTHNFLLWLRAFLFFIVTLILLMFNKLDILTLAWAFSASYIFVGFYCFLRPVHGALIFRWKRNAATQLLGYSLPFYVTGVTQQLVDTLPRLIGIRYVDASVLGNFYNGNYYARLINKFSDPVMGLLYGELSSLDTETAAIHCARAVRIVSLISFGASLVFFFAIDFAIVFFYASGFESSASFAKAFLPVVFFVSVTNVIFNFFSSQGMAALSTKIQLISLVMMVGSLIYLVPQHNVVGMLIGANLSYLMMFFTSIFFFLKVSKRSFAELVFKPEDIVDLGLVVRDSVRQLGSK